MAEIQVRRVKCFGSIYSGSIVFVVAGRPPRHPALRDERMGNHTVGHNLRVVRPGIIWAPPPGGSEHLDQIAVRGRSERRLWSLAFSVKSAAIPCNHASAEFNPEPDIGREHRSKREGSWSILIESSLSADHTPIKIAAGIEQGLSATGERGASRCVQVKVRTGALPALLELRQVAVVRPGQVGRHGRGRCVGDVATACRAVNCLVGLVVDRRQKAVPRYHARNRCVAEGLDRRRVRQPAAGEADALRRPIDRAVNGYPRGRTGDHLALGGIGISAGRVRSPAEGSGQILCKCGCSRNKH